MIEVCDLTIKRGKYKIISKLNFKAEAKKITIIVGPNGSGKTTLLNAITEDIKYSGNIFINSVNITSLNSRKKAKFRGVLPQLNTMSFPFFVSEVLNLGFLSGNAKQENIDKFDIIKSALNYVDLIGYENRLYQELSGGEQARVQLARVLCQIWHPIYNDNPCWLLLDEPVASLDIAHQLIIMNLAREFVQSGGGVIAVLHDLNLASCYADQMAMMKNGEILYSGTPNVIMTSENIEKVYDCKICVNKIPVPQFPFILPQTIKTEL